MKKRDLKKYIGKLVHIRWDDATYGHEEDADEDFHRVLIEEDETAFVHEFGILIYVSIKQVKLLRMIDVPGANTAVRVNSSMIPNTLIDHICADVSTCKFYKEDFEGTYYEYDKLVRK